MPDQVRRDARARAEWQRLIRAMPPAFFTGADRPIRAVHCLTWSILLRALAEIEDRGSTTECGKGKTVRHPAQVIAHRAIGTLLRTSDALGLTPGARTRLHMPMPSARNGSPDSADDLPRG